LKKTSLYCTLVLGIVSTGLAATGHHLLKKISVGGQGDWDYLTVDDVARALRAALQHGDRSAEPSTVYRLSEQSHGRRQHR
jgi:nucleoside-diphosphate-sugar epimerase